MKYAYKQGFGVPGIAAEVAHEEMERIRRESGLTPSAVVEAARPEDSILHPAFEWDDAVAAEEYRLNQARRLIRVLVTVPDDEPPRTVYVHIPAHADKKEGEYERIEVVAERVDLFERALSQLETKLRSAQVAIAELEGAARVGGDPDRMAKVAIAVKALSMASDALSALH